MAPGLSLRNLVPVCESQEWLVKHLKLKKKKRFEILFQSTFSTLRRCSIDENKTRFPADSVVLGQKPQRIGSTSRGQAVKGEIRWAFSASPRVRRQNVMVRRNIDPGFAEECTKYGHRPGAAPRSAGPAGCAEDDQRGGPGAEARSEAGSRPTGRYRTATTASACRRGAPSFRRSAGRRE